MLSYVGCYTEPTNQPTQPGQAVLLDITELAALAGFLNLFGLLASMVGFTHLTSLNQFDLFV
jgi:hypothetical protein